MARTRAHAITSHKYNTVVSCTHHMRLVCQFSCGAASAVATKLVLETFPDAEVGIFNAFVRNEPADNRRFLADCERWFGRTITVLQNDIYNADTHEVWRRKRYIKGRLGAPCSSELKRNLLDGALRPGDTLVIGYTTEEQDRLDKFIDANNGRAVFAPLIEAGLTKRDCFGIIERAGIELPISYRMGYSNANCVGCPKGGQAYWQAIRRDYPVEFAQIKTIQETIGPGAYFLRFRSGPRKDERMSLAELPPGEGNMADEPDFSCGVLCEFVDSALQK